MVRPVLARTSRKRRPVGVDVRSGVLVGVVDVDVMIGVDVDVDVADVACRRGVPFCAASTGVAAAMRTLGDREPDIGMTRRHSDTGISCMLLCDTSSHSSDVM